MKSMKKISFLTIGIILGMWIADVLTKYLVVKYFSDGSTLHIIGNFLRFHLVYNTGGVFGVFQGNARLFHVLSGLAILTLIVYYIKSSYDDVFFVFAMCFILGGALGNFTDRFFISGVVDFIDMGLGRMRWPTYNVADISLFTGVVLMMIALYRIEKHEKTLAPKSNLKDEQKSKQSRKK